MQKKTKVFGLTVFELCLWISSCIVMLASYVISPENGILNLISSLCGVTALIFIAKGHIAGQILTIIFALLYGYISLEQKYYGEMITYCFMSAPMAVFSLISWIRHPYKKSNEVEISSLKKGQIAFIAVFAVVITAIFYFILKALDTANLIFSTISVTTSFLAASLTFFRSHYYALGYTANDIVLIVLWVLASIQDPSYIVMVACFVMFLFNDLYGFFNWQKMKKRQDRDKI